MKYTILLDRQEHTKTIEVQEQNRFIKSIFESLGAAIEWDPDAEPTIESRQKLRYDLEKFNLKILNDLDGGVKIYVGEDLIAEWYKPKYKMKQDHSKLDRKEQLYLEMGVNFWTIFEDHQEEEQMQQT